MTNSVNNAMIYLKEGEIMPNNDLFSDIPALGDEQGLENLLNQQALTDMGVQPTQDPEPAQEPAQQSNTYTNEQIQQIIARNQQLEAQLNQPQTQPVQRQVAQQNQVQGYNPQQIAIINRLLASGMTIGQINDELNKRRANNVNPAVMQRIQALEQHLQQQQYDAAANAFEQKMLTFGEKFGLSEDELVLFGNTALSKGINVAHVTDLEAVFRAIYPDQYALRMQRINNNNTAPIYGGVSVSEAPRAQASKLEDAYVDSFLRGAMPNQYNMYKK